MPQADDDKYTAEARVCNTLAVELEQFDIAASPITWLPRVPQRPCRRRSARPQRILNEPIPQGHLDSVINLGANPVRPRRNQSRLLATLRLPVQAEEGKMFQRASIDSSGILMLRGSDLNPGLLPRMGVLTEQRLCIPSPS